MLVVGLMSGTSADGIDVGLVEIQDGPDRPSIRVVKHLTVDYDPALQAEIFACFRPETSGVDRLCRLNVALGEAYAAAILQVIAQAGLTPEQVDLIGSHGQTLWYDAPTPNSPGRTLVQGDPAIIAERTGITTISDIRSRDLAAGGRGAPLASYLDWILFRDPESAIAIQNIGGIGNVTALPGKHDTGHTPLTFDTGPGNMIIDYCVSRVTNNTQKFDRGGLLAAQGKVDETLVEELMQEAYLHQPPPKTTGRELFGAQFGLQVWEKGQQRGLRAEDIIATATAFTAESIATAYRDWIPFPVKNIYVAGGGALNPTLLDMLENRSQTKVHVHDELGIPAAAKECILFALLAYETWYARPFRLPILTGASHSALLGNITPGRNWRSQA